MGAVLHDAVGVVGQAAGLFWGLGAVERRVALAVGQVAASSDKRPIANR